MCIDCGCGSQTEHHHHHDHDHHHEHDHDKAHDHHHDQPARTVRIEEDLLAKNNRLASGNRALVITSYSIHYTKLYERRGVSNGHGSGQGLRKGEFGFGTTDTGVTVLDTPVHSAVKLLLRAVGVGDRPFTSQLVRNNFV